jgi:hypothetical protein
MIIGKAEVDIIVSNLLGNCIGKPCGSTIPNFTATPGRISIPTLTPRTPEDANDNSNGFNGVDCFGATSARLENVNDPSNGIPKKISG